MTSTATAVPTVPSDLDVKQLSKDLTQAVREIKEIQVLVTSIVDTIIVRKNDEMEKETQKIKSTMKQVHAIIVKLDKLGSKYKIRLNDIHAVPLGNSGYVSLDPSEEKSGFYKDLLECYTWLKNIDRNASQALELILKQQYASQCKQTLPLSNSTKSLVGMVEDIKPEFANLSFNTTCLSTDQCLEVKMKGVFAVYIYFSGLTACNCIVKSIEESFTLELSEPSGHKVFQKLTDILISVVLTFFHETPEVILRLFLKRVTAYENIFHTKCAICEKHLSGSYEFLPPLLFDGNKGTFSHITCK